jgi:hypothetical protein
MKTTKRFIVLFLLSLIFQSCENESTVNETPNNQQPNNSENLISITVNSTWVNYLEVFNFNNGEITDVQFSDGLYHLYEYTGEKVSKIEEFNSNGDILFTKTFQYDVNDRLVKRTILPNVLLTEWENYVSYEFMYTDTSITIVYKVFDFNNVQQYPDGITNLELNQNNIISYYNEGFYSFRSEASYLQNDPITYQRYTSDVLVEDSSYTYLNSIAADAYSIGKFKFGNAWKINTLLSYDGIGTYTLDEVSTKYLSTVTSNLYFNGVTHTKTENYDYEFNEDNLLIGQTQTSISTQSNTVYVTEITYQYE